MRKEKRSSLDEEKEEEKIFVLMTAAQFLLEKIRKDPDASFLKDKGLADHFVLGFIEGYQFKEHKNDTKKRYKRKNLK